MLHLFTRPDQTDGLAHLIVMIVHIEQGQSEKASRQSVYAYLIQPVQRIPRYRCARGSYHRLCM
jgi:hypothetical protein